jgi:hypothetical protein
MRGLFLWNQGLNQEVAMYRILLVSLCLTIPLATMADSLLTDPGFAEGIDPPWSVSITTTGVSWDMNDEAGAVDSGSLLFTDVGEFGALVSQCVEISTELVSGAGFSYLIPVDVAPLLFAPEIVLRYYEQPLCAGSSVGSETIGPPTPVVQGTWTRVEAPITPAAGAASLSFGLYFAGSGSSNNRAFVDNALLGNPPVFRDRFEQASPP